MKLRISFLIFGLCPATLSLFAADVRTINNRSVDLQPIHEWRATNGPAETRPLKHWKDLNIVEIQQTISSTMHVAKVDIDGTAQTITLRNMPRDLSAKINRLQLLRSHLGSAERGTAAATANAQAAQMRASSSYYVSGSPDYVNAVAAEEERKANQAAAATANAAMASASLDSIKKEIAELSAEVKATRILAMATGGTYAGKAQYDTGLK